MSLDFRIRLDTPLPFPEFLKQARATLCSLLDVNATDLPEFEVEEIEGGIRSPLKTLTIDKTGPMWCLGWSTHRIELVCFSIADNLREELGGKFDESTLDADDEQPYVYVTVRGLGFHPDALKWAVGAACALALGKMTGNNVVDESRAWTETYEQSAETLFHELKSLKTTSLTEARSDLLRELRPQ